MKLSENKLTEFIDLLSSKAAVPGGGGASALAGALGCALGIMVTNLTIGKDKYKNYDRTNENIRTQLTQMQLRLIDLIQEDADNFKFLAKAYSLPTNTEMQRKHKKQELERCSIKACAAPIEIIELSFESLHYLGDLVSTGSDLVLSDVAVAAELIRSALSGGWINILINLENIKNDTDFLDKCKSIRSRIDMAKQKADTIYDLIQCKLVN